MPVIADLSREQSEIIFDAKADENILITGPPGTGKTVVAMWRANQLADYHEVKIALTMYNVVLMKYSGTWQGKNPHVNVLTHDSWVGKTYWRAMKKFTPRTGGNWTPYDWDKITQDLSEQNLSLGHLLIDEGQDFSVDFYDMLNFIYRKNPDSSTICVCLDENQKLEVDENVNRQQVKRALFRTPVHVKMKNEFKLERNYRNTRQIAKLSRQFYVGLPTGVPELPTKVGNSVPIASKHGSLDDQMQKIAEHMVSNPSHSCLVVSPSLIICQKTFNRLSSNLKDVPNVTVNGYANRNIFVKNEPLKISEPGSVTCVIFKSMKGLEADAVFVPCCDEFSLGSSESETEDMTFYVMTSRAREHLEFLYDENVDFDMNSFMKKLKTKSSVNIHFFECKNNSSSQSNPPFVELVVPESKMGNQDNRILITSLPVHGKLITRGGIELESTPCILASNDNAIGYKPSKGFEGGLDDFTYRVISWHNVLEKNIGSDEIPKEKLNEVIELLGEKEATELNKFFWNLYHRAEERGVHVYVDSKAPMDAKQSVSEKIMKWV